jgi:diphthamide synthase (EF-2-diphthine--ammonia ligase)
MEEWLGREFNKTSVNDLKAFSKEIGIDPFRQNRKYYTLTFDGQTFKEAIEISQFSTEKRKD